MTLKQRGHSYDGCVYCLSLGVYNSSEIFKNKILQIQDRKCYNGFYQIRIRKAV